MENALGAWKKSVKIAMIERDMDMEALAKAVGKSRTHISAVINGRRAFQRQPYQRRAEHQKRAVFRNEARARGVDEGSPDCSA